VPDISNGLSFLLAVVWAGGLILLTVFIHYEALRLLSEALPRLNIQPRLRLLVVIIGVFVAHTIEVWVFGLAYYAMSGGMELGRVTGATTGHFFDFVYFSAVVYTSLGFGDIMPVAHVRMLAGVEALVGLLMIGWSASFTYLMMERFWPDHRRR
jgi:hypothetical protein